MAKITIRPPLHLPIIIHWIWAPRRFIHSYNRPTGILNTTLEDDDGVDGAFLQSVYIDHNFLIFNIYSTLHVNPLMIVRGQLNRRSLWTGHEAKEEEPVPLSCTYHPAMQNAPYQYINTSDHVPIINADHFAINPSQSSRYI